MKSKIGKRKRKCNNNLKKEKRGKKNDHSVGDCNLPLHYSVKGKRGIEEEGILPLRRTFDLWMLENT